MDGVEELLLPDDNRLRNRPAGLRGKGMGSSNLKPCQRVWAFICHPGVWGTLAGIGIVVFCVQTPWIVLKAANTYRGEIPDFAERGQFGDMYGLANAVFSGLAFLGLIIAIHLQRQDLMVNTAVLLQSKVEMEKTNRALTEQTTQMKYAGLLSALPVMIEQQKARLHTIAPQYFLPAGDAGYTVESIERFIAHYGKAGDRPPFTERFSSETALPQSELAFGGEADEDREAARAMQRRKFAETTFNERRGEVIEVMRLLKEHLEALKDVHGELKARL